MADAQEVSVSRPVAVEVRVVAPPANPKQREAIEYCDGPLQVIAGPGTGKTRVITDKVVYLVREKGIPPEAILALTFTDKAAEEMAGRIRSALAAASIRGQPQVSTFHSFCLDLVEENTERLGYLKTPRLLVGPLFVQFILDNIDAFPLRGTDLVGKVVAFAETLSDFVSLCHDEGIVDQDLCALVDRWAQETALGEDDAEVVAGVRDLAAAVPILRTLQRKHGIVTYGDLLTESVSLLKRNATARKELQERYQYALVDEFQDNNRSQFELVSLLSAGHHRLMVVGDEDQSIYRFRGARMDLMREFREGNAGQPTGPSVKVVTLEENYRSTEAIITTFQTLIEHNKERFGEKRIKRATTSTIAGPDQVQLKEAPSEDRERAHVVRAIQERLGKGGRKPGDIAILCRSLAHTTDLVDDLRKAGVPVEVVGGGGLFSNPVVREIIAWLKVLDDPTADEAALHRVLRMRGFGLTYADQRALGRAADKQGVPAFSLIERLTTEPSAVPDLSPEGAARLRGFLAAYERFHEEAEAQNAANLLPLIQELLRFTGLTRKVQPDTVTGRHNLAALSGLLQAASNYQEHYPFASLAGFVSHLDLLESLGHDETVGEPSTDKSTVKVMTIHQSKGREFPVVIIPGVGDRYPSKNRRAAHRKFLDHLTLPGDPEAAHLEEERRVLYVALSRAKEELLLTTPATRNGKPVNESPFLAEIRKSPRINATRLAESTESGGTEPPVGLTTREVLEERLAHVLSRLGTHTEGALGEAAVTEAFRLMGGVIVANASPEASPTAAAAKRALAALGVPEEEQIRLPAEDKPAGVSGPLHLSASSLNVYKDCPRQFYYARVARIPQGGGGEAAGRGTVIHAALETFHRKHPRPQPEHLDVLMALLETEGANLAFDAAAEREQWFTKMRDVFHVYLQEEAARGTEVLTVEQEFTLTLGEDVSIHGFIDRVDRLPDGRLRVIDYKSGGVKSRPHYLNEDFQMPLYAWAVQEALGKELHSVEVIGLKELKHLKRGTELERAVLPWEDGSKYVITAELLQQVRLRVAEAVAGIREGRFEPQPGERRCGWCAYRLLCNAAP